MRYCVRKATMEDLPRIEEIYAYARKFMAENGNPNQWGKTNPPHAQLIEDIARDELHVMEDSAGIHGVFFFKIGPDLTYANIFDGFWREDTPYGTIHRIAGDGSGRILNTAVQYCSGMINHLRIDTHRDNHVMQKALDKQGFSMRGIIYIADGSPRIAYDRLTQI